MGNDRLNKVVLALTAAVVGFLAGEMLSPLNSWPERLQWETLITGVLAIAAAAWTVSQMRVSDIGQKERHLQLVDLTLRDERRRIARVQWTAKTRLVNWIKSFEELEAAGFRLSDRAVDMFAFDNAVDAILAADELIELFREINATSAKELLDGRAAAVFETLSKRVTKIAASRDAIHDEFKSGDLNGEGKLRFQRFVHDISAAKSASAIVAGYLVKMDTKPTA
ncbi:hypothetical protein BPNPMPFG_000877 [Mesorhizobium sp. AR07]|uniref:hypothetical protein n=1 Tax=Mesorhizobium sp. AR07 TaxID=2865838 RepID=UPI002160CFBA|nr:hypothetical protein [Mesorhizobium sp. AR07]UVK45350.1 hypothetical protein BPNPMPFG_000877 [Mesorhizobium sp. AR07]